MYGLVVCLVKNLIHLMGHLHRRGPENCAISSSGGQLCGPGGPYLPEAEVPGAARCWGVALGAVIMGVFSIPLNYYITYPIYSNFMPIDTIIGMYQAIRPSANGLLECLITFNAPFTLFKGLVDAAPVLPYLQGRSLPLLHKGL